LPIKFIDDKNIGYVYKNMGLFIGRAGANTVYEIGLLAKPSIFIPIPWVTNNEQFLNAKVLVDLGLSTIIEEKELKKLTLNEIIEVEISKLSKKKINVEEIKRMFPANAVEKVLNDMYT
jgi:UDP-N-acetylglucosamine--N-acetylmuramyl-(pentapeptide) pyrophosphoryl-undecaprenol N-acetylglucosamine transferase